MTATRPSSGTPLLTLEDVAVVLSGRVVLSDVSFALGAGQVTGLIGQNGAGKTTVMRVVLGLLRPSRGVVHRVGDGRRGVLGYVPQQLALDPDLPLRARDVVGLGLDGHRLGLPLPSRRRRRLVDEMLAEVGAERFADARVGTLSGGQQQRVLLAQALVGRPQVVVLDEPLANLDLRSEQEVADLLGRIAAEQGVAVLVSAHDVNPLLPVMSQVVYLADGRAASGTTEEVVRSEVLSRLYGHHVDVLEVHGRILVVPGGLEREGMVVPPGDSGGAVEPGVVSRR